MVKNPPANAGDTGSISGSGKSPGEGNDNLPQFSCLGNPMDRGAWRATVPGEAESDTTKMQCSATDRDLSIGRGEKAERRAGGRWGAGGVEVGRDRKQSGEGNI